MIKEYLNKTVFCVDVILSTDNIMFDAVSYQVNRNTYVEQQRWVNVKDIDALSGIITKGAEVRLVISGKGIMYRLFDNHDIGSEYSELLKFVVPNANEEDFYYQTYDFESSTGIALARRTTIDEVLAKLGSNAVFVTHLFLSPAIYAFSLKNDHLSPDTVVKYPNYKLQFSNWALSAIIYTPANSEIDAEAKSNDNLVLVIDSIKNLDGKTLNNVRDNLSEISKNKEEFKFYNLIKSSLIYGLASILLILLVNTYFFFNYSEKHNKLSNELVFYNKEIFLFDSLNSELTQKRQFLDSLGYMKPSRISFYVDRIVSVMPTELSLSQINVFPVIETEKSGQISEVAVSHNRIFIKGLAIDGVAINAWIKKLKGFDWIMDIQLGYNRPDNDKDAIFQIDITLND